MPRAPKHCSKDGCTNKALPNKRNCADHGDNRWPTDKGRYKLIRTDEIAANYPAVLFRDKGLCQLRYKGLCETYGRQLDHRIPRFMGGTDDVDNLQLACKSCHEAKSSDEGHIAQGHKVPERERISL